MPKHIQPSANVVVRKQRYTIPQKEQVHRHNVPTEQRASSPDIMMVVSDAFSDVDISFEGSRPIEKASRRLIEQSRRPMIGNEPPLQSPASLEEAQSSLQTISKAFSDVDVSFENDKKTVSQRRKELEYLSKTWTKSQTQDNGSTSGGAGGGGMTSQNKNVTAAQQQQPKATTWANEPQKSPSRVAATTKYKKVSEPTVRLKGNKSLAQKFASLVKAYDD